MLHCPDNAITTSSSSVTVKTSRTTFQEWLERESEFGNDRKLKEFLPHWKGVVVKQGHIVKNWKERYFIIINDLMIYYKSENDFTGGLSPLGYQVVLSVSQSSDSNTITVKTQSDKKFNLRNPPLNKSSGLFEALQRASQVTATSEQTLKCYGHSQLQLAISLSQSGYIEETIDTLLLVVSMSSLSNMCAGILSFSDPSRISRASASISSSNASQDLDDHYILYLYHLGTAYLVDQNFDMAIKCLQLAVNVDLAPQSSIAQRQSKVFQEELSSLLVPCMINLSTAHYLLGDSVQGLEVLKEALRLDPKNVEALNNIVVLLSQTGAPSDIELAENYITRALSLNRKDPRLYVTFSDFMVEVQKKPLSLALDTLYNGLEEVLEEKSCPMLLRIGELLASGANKEQQDEALEYFERAVSADPNCGRAIELYSRAVEYREENDDMI